MLKAYAYQNKSDILLKSSSGGAFSAIISTFFLNNQESVAIYGAAFDDALNVRHMRVDNLADCHFFNGSKYVLSNIGGCFLSVEEDLKKSYQVIFSGTPCQINALNLFLVKNNCPTENLLTVDILCHGIPTAKLWADYRHWLEEQYDSKLVYFSFRYKGGGKKNRMKYPMYARFENGKVLEDSFLLRLYMTLYFSGLVYRDSCYKCDFSSSVRCSDITIGDFWQYNEAMRKKEPGGGMSLVLINTEKGMCVAERMSEEDVYMEECNVERLLATQKTFGATDKNTENIDIFREDYKNFGIEFVLKKYAGYNLKGRLKHILKKSLIVTGMMPIINSLSGK